MSEGRLENCLCACGGYRPRYMSINVIAEIDDIAGRIANDSGFGSIEIVYEKREEQKLIYTISRKL